MTDTTAKSKTGLYVIVAIATFLLMAFLVRQMVNYTTPPAVGADRAEARAKDNADIRAIGTAQLGTYSFVDPAKGVVRLPVDEAIRLTVQGYRNAEAFHSDLVARVEKATAAPPAPPQQPNEYE